jgi:hypothetical protein
LKRVTSGGVTEEQARTDICHAVADGKIRIRVLVDKAAPDVGGKTLQGGNVQVPPRLAPADFDWIKSRPVEAWNTGPNSRIPTERYFALWTWERRCIQLIELSTADVVEILGGQGASAPGQAPAHVERRPAFGPGNSPQQDARSAHAERPATSAADIVEPKRSRRGPAPNTVDRYGETDRALFAELDNIRRESGKSLTAAALQLAEAKRVNGAGTAKSRATRLVRRYNAEGGSKN